MATEPDDAIEKMFTFLSDYAEKDRALRKEIGDIARELEFCEREIVVILDRVHSVSKCGTDDLFKKCSEIIDNRVKPLYEKLAKLISPNIYYKFHDVFRYATQRIAFAVIFAHFLESNQLIDRDAVAKRLGLEVSGENGFHLDLEDYLHGVLHSASELARFAVNAVAAGDNVLPLQIAKFVKNIDSRFRLLNLKNDSLRKRFDSLKYELQKCDQVVYDLTIRGMIPREIRAKGGDKAEICEQPAKDDEAS